MKKEDELNFKKTIQQPNEKCRNLCTRCGGKPNSIRSCPALSKKSNILEKVGHFSKMCRTKPNQVQVSTEKQKIFSEENISSEQASPQLEMVMFYTKKQNLKHVCDSKYISINNCKVKMQLYAGADSTAISPIIWTELSKPQLDDKMRYLEAYDGHQLMLLGTLTCDVEWTKTTSSCAV